MTCLVSKPEDLSELCDFIKFWEVEDALEMLKKKVLQSTVESRRNMFARASSFNETIFNLWNTNSMCGEELLQTC